MSEANIWSNVTIPDGTKNKYLNPNDYFTVLVPTANNMMNIDSYTALICIAKGLGKQLQISASVKSGIPSSRNLCTHMCKLYYGVDNIRGLWLDSDIAICSVNPVVDAIRYADKKRITFTANYKTGTLENIKNLIYKSEDNDSNYTDEELEALPDMAPIGGFAGLGFCYGDIPLNYCFHADANGEDYYYFHDNKIKLHYAKHIILRHGKGVFF